MSSRAQQETLFGHPVGLFTLFFAEMWERFSYYGMRALLLFYMIKGFLGFNDTQAYGVYGAYTALVYATPFIGGVLADRILGARRAVIIGGILMSAGHLLMTLEVSWAFFTALALLIVGNGFFKPNISTIVGGLYPPGSSKKDAGFTLFYMGINLGAAMSPLLCGYIGETYGWHYGFGLATFGMLTGLAVFTAPRRVAQALILVGCLGASISLFKFQNNIYQLGVNGVVGVAMLIAGLVGATALQRGGVPTDAGLPRDPQLVKQHSWKVYLGIAASVPLIAIMVQRSALAGVVLGVLGFLAFGWLLMQSFQRDKVARERMFVVLILMFFSMLFWAFFEQAGSSVNNFTDRNVDRVLTDDSSKVISEDQVGKLVKFDLNQEQVGYKVNLDQENLFKLIAPSLTDLPAKRLLAYSKQQLTGIPMSSDEEQQKQTDQRTAEMVGMRQADFELLNTDRQLVAIYEKLASKTMPTDLDGLRAEAKTSLGLTDDQVNGMDKVDELQRKIVHGPLGLTSEKLQALTSEDLQQLAKTLLDYSFDENQALIVTINVRDNARKDRSETIEWSVTQDHVGMDTGGAEVPASIFQSVNPIFIILFAPLFSALWERLGAIGREPSTPVKFALGITQLGLGFACLWMGARSSDQQGMVWLGWLFLGYLFQTTGELCLSPVGLSMVTKLSPADIVSTVMGAWFMATAFSNYLAGIIATFTGVGHGAEGGSSIPVPMETVNVYGHVFGIIAGTAALCGVFCLALSPLLKRWMHQDVVDDPAPMDVYVGAPIDVSPAVPGQDEDQKS